MLVECLSIKKAYVLCRVVASAISQLSESFPAQELPNMWKCCCTDIIDASIWAQNSKCEVCPSYSPVMINILHQRNTNWVLKGCVITLNQLRVSTTQMRCNDSCKGQDMRTAKAAYNVAWWRVVEQGMSYYQRFDKWTTARGWSQVPLALGNIPRLTPSHHFKFRTPVLQRGLCFHRCHGLRHRSCASRRRSRNPRSLKTTWRLRSANSRERWIRHWQCRRLIVCLQITQQW